MTASQKEQPVFHVTAMTHRNRPILPVVCPGEPVDDHLCMSLSLAADALACLRRRHLPVIMTHIPPMTALHLLVVAVDKQAYEGADLARDVGDSIGSAKIGTLLPKIIVVDKDIDATDMDSVLWSFATKCHPETTQETGARCPENSLEPYSPTKYGSACLCWGDHHATGAELLS